MPDLKKKFLYQLLLALSQVLFPLITYPYLTRILGPDGLGKVGYVEFIAAFIITILSVGIPFYGVREIAKAKNDKPKRSKLTAELILIHTVCSIAGILLFIFFLGINKNFQHENELIVLGASYILLQVFTIEWYLQGTEAFEFIALRTIFIRIAGIVAIFLFVKDQNDYVLYYGIMVAAQFFVAFTAVLKAGKENSLSFRNPSLKPHAKPLLYFFLTSSFISIYVFFDTIILGWLSTDEHVGYYTLGLRVIKLPMLLFLSLNTILYPRISYLHTTDHGNEIEKLFRFSINFIITVTIPVCICFYLLAPEIVAVLAGEDFKPTVKVIQLLSPLPLLIGFTNFFILQVLAPSHKERSVMIAVLIACIVSLSMNFWLIPRMNEPGAAIAALVTEGIVFLLVFNFSFGKVKNSFSIKNVFITLALSALSIPLVLILRSWLYSPVYILVASLMFFFIVYVCIQYYIFKNEVIKAMIIFAKSPFGNREKRIANVK